jgi:hypothetical protein
VGNFIRLSIIKTGLCLAILFSTKGSVFTQGYVGGGLHFSPPVHFDHSSTTHFEAYPELSQGFSISWRFEKPVKENRSLWNFNLGVGATSIDYESRDYYNEPDPDLPYAIFDYPYFVSYIFAGLGKTYPLSKNSERHWLGVGVESSLRLGSYDFHSDRFGFSSREPDLPFLFRLDLNYGYHFNILGGVPAKVEVYSMLTPQPLINGRQYIRDPITGMEFRRGQFRLNHSQLGVRLLSEVAPQKVKIKRDRTKRLRKIGKEDIRISAVAQYCRLPSTDVYVPQVDSFSIDGHLFNTTWQLGVQAELFNFQNSNWLTTFGLGVGRSRLLLQLSAMPEYKTTEFGPISKLNRGSDIGTFLMPNLGLGYTMPIGKHILQHSFSTHLFLTLGREDLRLGVSDSSYFNLPFEQRPRFLEVEVNHQYRNGWVFFGFEYRPEMVFIRSDRRSFAAVGLVFNYTFGDIYRGAVTVDNERTAYHGAIVQQFSKIGISARIGWNGQKMPGR